MSIVALYLHCPEIFFMLGNVKRFKWNVRTSGSFVNSDLILAFDVWLHFSHRYSDESSLSSFRKVAIHFSRDVSKLMLRVMNGLNVVDGFPHLLHITTVFWIPVKV